MHLLNFGQRAGTALSPRKLTHTFIASLLPTLGCFPSQQYWRIRLGHEEQDQGPLHTRPDEQDPEGPSPVRVLVDEATNDWSDLGTNELPSVSEQETNVE